MQLTVTGRHFTVDDALRSSVENKLMAVLEQKRLKISSATVVLDVERNRCRADISVQYKHHEANASVEGFDMYKVIDEAMVKIDTQMAKFLDKVQDHHGAPLREVAGEPVAE